MSGSTWLPNLVGGTSIWKLAVDLNEPKFFDGRLLVPETEGSESLPVTVRWDLTGLLPLAEARTKHPEAVTAAIADFQAALERVAKVFSTPNSGFDRYREAFTIPSLEADGGANYFFSPEQKKLFVVNWGASPRTMGGRAEYVFGYEDWGRQWSAGAGTVPPPANSGLALEAEGQATPKKEEAKTEPKKDDGKARPWWFFPLLGLVAIALVLLALFLLKACDEHDGVTTTSGAPDALAEAASSTDASSVVDGATDGATAASDASADAASDASANGDGGADAGADAAAIDGGNDGGSADGGKDAGGSGAGGDDDDDDFPLGPGGSSGGAGSSGGTVTVKIGPGGGEKTSVHRKHYSDDAVKWRVSAGAHKVSRTEDAGKRFDVWLAPGQTFEGVRIEWQDKSGTWHVH